MRIEMQFPTETSFAMLASDFNKRLDDMRPEFSVKIGLPTSKASDPESEVFWLFWETNKLPSYPLRLLRTYHHVWTPSTWLANVLVKNGIESRVVHVAVDPALWSPMHTAHSTFRFLWVNEWIHRKGGDVLVEAFLDAFTPKDDVELVIKPKYTNQNCAARFPTVEEIIASHHGGPKEKIRIVNEFLSQEKLLALYQSSSCYVYPFRTQGASLTLLEAQACGLPPIATKYAGCLDYAVNDCTYFIEPSGYKELTRMDFFSTYLSQSLGIEAIPNSGQLKETLRYCFEHPAEVKSRGLRASQVVRDSFSWEAMKKEVNSALDYSPPRKSRMRFWKRA